MSVGGWRPSRLDVLLAVAVVLSGIVESVSRQGQGPGQIHAPLPVAVGAVLAGVLLLLRRRAPVAVLVALTVLGEVVRSLAERGGYQYTAWQLYSTLIVVHTVGSAAELHSRRGAVGLTAVLAGYLWLQTFPERDVAEVLITAVFVGVAYGSGVLLRRQTERSLHLYGVAARAEAERDERARRAVEAERGRIAREMHDVVAHKVSVMTMHVGALRMTTSSGRDHDLLLDVERTGREAVDELRTMLGVLRAPGDPSGPADMVEHGLEDLTQPLRAGGIDVRTRVRGDLQSLPADLRLAVHRIVQEAVTNVLKHAGAGRVEVTVTRGRDVVAVEVLDDGAGHGPGAGSGFGVIGMAERAAQHGGVLVAGPGPAGGYRVLAAFGRGPQESAGAC